MLSQRPPRGTEMTETAETTARGLLISGERLRQLYMHVRECCLSRLSCINAPVHDRETTTAAVVSDDLADRQVSHRRAQTARLCHYLLLLIDKSIRYPLAGPMQARRNSRKDDFKCGSTNAQPTPVGDGHLMVANPARKSTPLLSHFDEVRSTSSTVHGAAGCNAISRRTCVQRALTSSPMGPGVPSLTHPDRTTTGNR